MVKFLAQYVVYLGHVGRAKQDISSARALADNLQVLAGLSSLRRKMMYPFRSINNAPFSVLRLKPTLCHRMSVDPWSFYSATNIRTCLHNYLGTSKHTLKFQ